MRNYIKIGLVITGILASSMAIADDNHHSDQGMSGDPAQMQQMMEKRMAMMKDMLKLNADQEKKFDAFAKQKNAMMNDMIAKQAMMKNSKDMNHDKMDNMQGGQMAMMQMMSGLSFEQHLKMMEDHGEKMLATSKSGKTFFSSLNSDQKKKLNDMPKQMHDMKM